ncbi:MAG: hypothetical protein M3Z13_04225 [Candidatus Dormibacteraeota bacterium]|nr:hypothetical protein [Candidatus Dormibacteraeota bacterium]
MAPILAIAVLVLLAACGGGAATQASKPTPAPSPSPSPSPTPTPAPLTADTVITAAKAIGLPIAEATVFTADSDPEKLLGHPNQYTAKGVWHDSRLPVTPARPPGTDVQDGGAIELFANADDLHARSRSLAGAASTEFDYSSDKGYVLLRLSRQLTAEQAGQYAQALKLILPDLNGPA